jgi:hypothetical protein
MTNSLAEATQRVGAADRILVEHPRVREANETFDKMRAYAAQQSSRGTSGFLMVAPPQTGKSTIIHAYSTKLNTEEALREGRIPALVVTLQANQTRKGLAQDILKGFEKHELETGWKSGTEATLLDRAQTYIRKKRTEIVFLDEFHHLVHSDNKSVAVSVAETIKWLLIEAVVPVVMSGIEDAWKPIRANPQLAMRCERPLEMKRLDVTDAADRKLFAGFLARYLVEFETRKIAPNATRLLQIPGIPDMIQTVSAGVLGRACNLLKEALFLAVLDGRDEIDPGDLAVATERKFVSMGIVDRNPFTDGLQSISPARRAA